MGEKTNHRIYNTVFKLSEKYTYIIRNKTCSKIESGSVMAELSIVPKTEAALAHHISKTTGEGRASSYLSRSL